MKHERFRLISAVHLFLLQHNRILLLRRFNTGYQDGNYSVPAGHLDGGESASEAMMREAKEEVDIGLRLDDVKMIHVMHRKAADAERIDFFFEATKWQGKIKNMEPNKCDELKWVAIDKLPQNVVPYVKGAIKHYRNSTFFSEFGWN